MSQRTVTLPGGGLCTLLTVLFVGLKLTGHIGWSWWWVLAPLWGALAVWLIIFGVVVAIAAALAVWR